jgi:hypothetical protein
MSNNNIFQLKQPEETTSDALTELMRNRERGQEKY